MRLRYVFLGFFILGCSDTNDFRTPIGDSWARRVGLIDPGFGPNSPSPVVLPDTVTAGVPFTAVVSTYGGTGCVRPDRSNVLTAGLTADITPYDSVYVGPNVCLADLHAYPRPVQLQFSSPGSAQIRVHGRSIDSTVTLERSITVRP